MQISTKWKMMVKPHERGENKKKERKEAFLNFSSSFSLLQVLFFSHET